MDKPNNITFQEVYEQMPAPNLKYPPEVLQFLAQNVKGDTYEVFKLIWNKRKDGGVIKKDLQEAIPSRRRYDNAILILESTGFIYSVDDGRSIRYFPTVRGSQLKDYIKQKYDPHLGGEITHE